METVTKLTSFTTVIKNSISEATKVRVLYLMIKWKNVTIIRIIRE